MCLHACWFISFNHEMLCGWHCKQIPEEGVFDKPRWGDEVDSMLIARWVLGFSSKGMGIYEYLLSLSCTWLVAPFYLKCHNLIMQIESMHSESRLHPFGLTHRPRFTGDDILELMKHKRLQLAPRWGFQIPRLDYRPVKRKDHFPGENEFLKPIPDLSFLS